MVSKQNNQKLETNTIVVTKLQKKLDNKMIIDDISFSIPQNTIYSIIGTNGSGKTTLIRLLLNLLKKDYGYVSYTYGEHNIAALLENDYLYETKTGWENILFFYSTFGSGQKEDCLKKAKIYITQLLLDSAIDLKVATYSKGMKRKLSLIIILLRDMPFIILDEPTGGIDPLSRILIRNVLVDLKKEGKTILLTSHDLSEIEKCSDYISIIKDGKMVETFFNNKETINLEERFLKAMGADGCVYEK